jgi:hypothetical protein
MTVRVLEVLDGDLGVKPCSSESTPRLARTLAWLVDVTDFRLRLSRNAAAARRRAVGLPGGNPAQYTGRNR